LISIPTFGVIVNTEKEQAVSLARRFLQFMEERSVPCLVEAGAADLLNRPDKRAELGELRAEADYAVIFGGDGTMLRTAGRFCGTDIPLLGVNAGSLGFMTVIESESLLDAADDLLSGNFSTAERMMIEAVVLREGEEIYHCHGLNDVVISRGDNQNLINLDFHIDDEFIAGYQGDGIIASTPTGSTAYSLSAGGPIINPELDVMLLTPICPHNLYIRPMVIRGEESVSVEVGIKTGYIKISTDGRCDHTLIDGDEILLKKSSYSVRMVNFPDRNFYRILREKMKLGTF